MGAPAQIRELVKRFPNEKDELNETQVRQAYIDPFFEALGWDVASKKRNRQAFREVVLEDSIRVEGAKKAPDYGFYFAGARRFFVEAKEPSVDISTKKESAFQLRRYGWSAGLPFSILTDFEEFAIYDCRVQPEGSDKANTARIEYFKFDQYDEHWERIESLFSKGAVRDGSLDAFTADKKKGTQPVDKAFLKEIEGWRETLAKEIHRLNPTLDRYELNYAVQVTIDRIVFLRVSEDRGVEEYGRLAKLLESSGVYKQLCNLFREADERYNSGLFHFKKESDRGEPEDWTLGLAIRDESLKQVIEDLYYPKSPYQFSVMPVEILGQTYEQFLGSVIRIEDDGTGSGSGGVVIEEKPEVKKAGGVYYTPSYIVDYIVENTVGKLVEGKTPRQVSSLNIVDPACGSGSFLIGAYDYLLNWHLKWYVENNPEKHKKAVFEHEYHTEDGMATEWRLTAREKRDILLNNLHGVDIDFQAVEVTKLSLLLKVLEGETSESVNSQPSFFRERALPDLEKNIKSGNSLIGRDYYDTQQISLLEQDERRRINVFDWETAFPHAFKGKNPGFDAVIGNPPYLNIRLLTQMQGESVKEYFKSHYVCAHRGYDLYVLFIETGLQRLAERGLFGMIVPNKVATLDYALRCRSLLLENTSINRITDVSNLDVFSGVSVYPYVITFEKSPPIQDHLVSLLHADSTHALDDSAQEVQIEQKIFSADEGFTIHGRFDIESRVVTEPLSKVSRLHSGTTGFSAQQMAEYLTERDSCSSRNYLDFIVSGNIDRYFLRLGNVRFMKRHFDNPTLPDPERKLTVNKLDLYRNPKIIIAGMTKRLEATFDPGGLALGVQVYAAAELSADYRYLLGVLNSKFLSYLFWLRFQAKHLAGGYLAINKSQLSKLPIRTIDISDAADVERHDRMVSLVEQMMYLHQQLSQTKVPADKTSLQGQLKNTDEKIDRLIYELYGLTEDEIQIVEGSQPT